MMVSGIDGSQDLPMKPGAHKKLRPWPGIAGESSPLELVGSGAAVCDRDGRIVLCNARFLELMDTGREVLEGTLLVNLVHDDERDAMAERLAAEDIGVTAQECTLLRRNGEKCRCLVMVAPALDVEDAVSGSLVLVSRPADETLTDVDYRGLFEWAHDPILVFDPTTEEVLEVNRRACEVYGFPREEFIGMSLKSISEDVPRGEQRILETLDRGSEHRFETSQYTKDGRRMTLEVSGAHVRYRGRQAILSINRDVTEQRDLQRQLRHAQKMEALGRLAGGIAHEFNNLLQMGLATVEVVRDKEHDQAGCERATDELMAFFDRARSLTRQLLLFARPGDAAREAVDVADCIEALTTMLTRLLPEGVILRVVRDGEGCRVRIDPGHLEQVVTNLVINAADAMPGGGVVRVRVLDQKLRGWATVEVEDEGTGILEDHVTRVFDPFFTTKPRGRGTGLGLSVVHGIVTSCGGDIEVESTHGKGTLFRVLLPCCEAEEDSRGLVQRRVVRGEGQRLLVVEDDDAVRQALLDMLEVLGYRPTAVATAEQALDLQLIHECSVMITDLGLPGMSGLELAARLAELRPEVGVVVVTGYPDGITPQNAEGVRVLLKPFNLESLSQAVEQALAGSGPGEE